MAYATLGGLWGSSAYRIEKILSDNGINRIAWTKLRFLLSDSRMSDMDNVQELLKIIEMSLQEDDLGSLFCAMLILRHQFENEGLQELVRIRLLDPEFFLYIYERVHHFFQWRVEWEKELIDVRCVILEILYHLVTPEMDNKPYLLRRVFRELQHRSDSLAEERNLLRLIGKLIEVSSETIASEKKMMIRYASGSFSCAVKTCTRYLDHMYDGSFHVGDYSSAELELLIQETLRTVNIFRKVGFLAQADISELVKLCLNEKWEKRMIAVELAANILHLVNDSELLYERTAILLLRFIQMNRISVSDIYHQDNFAAVILCKMSIQYNIGDANRMIADELAELVYREKDKLPLQLIRQIHKFAAFYGIKGLIQAVDELLSVV